MRVSKYLLDEAKEIRGSEILGFAERMKKNFNRDILKVLKMADKYNEQYRGDEKTFNKIDDEVTSMMTRVEDFLTNLEMWVDDLYEK